MRRALLFVTAAFMLVPNAAAAGDVQPGWIGPGDTLYGVDVMLDDITSAVLKPPGEIAHERASEAFVAAEMNETEAMDRALSELEDAANRTNGVESGDGLQKAEQVLLEVRDKVPAQATFGIDTAIESVAQAKNRYPTDRQPNDTGPDAAPAQS
jgi:hypothetical protein